MSKTALIDADGIIYIACYNKKDSTEVKSLQDCKNAVDDVIKNILLATGSDKYLLFLTVGKNFRYDIYPEYKGNRKYSEKPEHFDRVKEYFITDYKAVYKHGLEADDLCLIYSKSIPNSFIASPDKDMLMLEGTHYNYNKAQWITTSSSEAAYNFWSSMITGDTADNIKGIPGKGEAYVKKVLQPLFSNNMLASIVFGEYFNKFGEELGVEEFYKNYKVLKIKDKFDGLILEEPIDFRPVKEDNEQTEGNTW